MFFNPDDIAIWAYILTVAVGSTLFLHRTRRAAEDLQKQLSEMELRLCSRIDELERGLRPQPHPRFKLIRSPDRQA